MDLQPPRIIHLTETGSTNADAMRLALGGGQLVGEKLPLWVAADRQTAGRGRAGRSWVSEAGNLHASLAFLSSAPLHQAGELALLAGIALLDAVRATSPLAKTIGLRLKWPNDLLIGHAKTGGILVETTTARGEPGFLAVIGFGLNVASCPGDLGRAVTSLGQHATALSIPAILNKLTAETAAWLAEWDNGRNFAAIRTAWLARAGAIGEAISIATQTGPVSGTFRGVSETGALLADIDGQRQTFTYGDVSLVAISGKDERP